MEVERTTILPASVEETWAALTTPDGLAAWFGAKAAVDLTPGGRLEFRWPDGSTRIAVFEAIEPGRTLTFRWVPFFRGPDGHSVQAAPTRVELALEVVPAGTRLRVVEAKLGGLLGASA